MISFIKPTFIKIIILMILPSVLMIQNFNCDGILAMKTICPIEREARLYYFNLPHLLLDIMGDRKREEERRDDQWPCWTDDCDVSPWKFFDRDQYYQSIVWIFIHYLLISVVFRVFKK